MWAIFSDVPQEQFGPESEMERVEESGRKTPLLISQGFSHGRGPERRWRKWSSWWVTKENENKQTEAAKEPDGLEHSLQRDLMFWVSRPLSDDVEDTAEGMKSCWASIK